MTVGLDSIPDQMYPFDALQAGSDELQWRVAHTKSRREKKLAAYMAANNMAYYLPLLKRRQPGKQRSRYSYVPAFGNYVFIKVSDHERHRAIRSNHIARILEVKDQTRLVKELQNLQSVMALEEKVYPYDYLEKGQRVRIIEGPMQGLEGVVERKKTGFRLVLNVSSIFQAVAVDIDSDLVEPIVEPKFVNRIY